MRKNDQKNEVDEHTGLNMRQELFCRHITNMAAETFDNATKSYTAAGYKSQNPSAPASVLLRNHRIKKRIRQLHAENLDDMGISKESVINNIRFDRNKAREANQWAVAATLDKLEGQILSMFADRVVIDAQPKSPELSDSEKAELDKIASVFKVRLAGGVN